MARSEKVALDLARAAKARARAVEEMVAAGARARAAEELVVETWPAPWSAEAWSAEAAKEEVRRRCGKGRVLMRSEG